MDIPEGAVNNGDVFVANVSGNVLAVLWPVPSFRALATDQVYTLAERMAMERGDRATPPIFCSGRVVAIVIEVEKGEGPTPEDVWVWQLSPPKLTDMAGVNTESTNPSFFLRIGPVEEEAKFSEELERLGVTDLPKPDPAKGGLKSLERIDG